MGSIDQKLLLKRARAVRLLILDVDGVMTDGRIVYTSSGEQVQAFHVHDGLGLKLLTKGGVDLAIISSRSSKALALRCRELGIASVFQGVSDKIEVYKKLKCDMEIDDSEVGYIGDDWVDIPLLKRVGFPVAVRNAAEPLADYAVYVTSRSGGFGAVREVCELILKAKDEWKGALASYLEKH